MKVKLHSTKNETESAAALRCVRVAAPAPEFHRSGAASGLENATVKNYTLKYLAIYRTGKSQYVGCFVYQIEALVNDVREVWMEHAVNTIREAKRNYEGHLDRRFNK